MIRYTGYDLSCSCKHLALAFILINVKKLFNGDTDYITQLKPQKSNRCYYFCSTSP